MEQYSVSLLLSLYIPFIFPALVKFGIKRGEARHVEKLKSAGPSLTAVHTNISAFTLHILG